jgi:hypothetical protein
MSIVLMGSTSGSCTLQEQAVAGTTTLTLPTTSGTVALTSDITTASVLTATAGASAGEVGAYSFLSHGSNYGIQTTGSTRAGSQLRYSGASSGDTVFAVTGGTPAGTWRLMGYIQEGGATSTIYVPSLWLRIS